MEQNPMETYPVPKFKTSVGVGEWTMEDDC